MRHLSDVFCEQVINHDIKHSSPSTPRQITTLYVEFEICFYLKKIKIKLYKWTKMRRHITLSALKMVGRTKKPPKKLSLTRHNTCERREQELGTHRDVFTSAGVCWRCGVSCPTTADCASVFQEARTLRVRRDRSEYISATAPCPASPEDPQCFNKDEGSKLAAQQANIAFHQLMFDVYTANIIDR